MLQHCLCTFFKQYRVCEPLQAMSRRLDVLITAAFIWRGPIALDASTMFKVAGFVSRAHSGRCSTNALLFSSECSRRGPLFSDVLQVSIFCQICCLGPILGAKICHQYYYSPGFNKVTLQSTHWSTQTLSISGGDSSCSWVFCLCTGPKCGVGVDLVDCNAVGRWPRSHQY